MWPLQPLQPLQKTQLQPPFGPSVGSICPPWFTTTNVSYGIRDFYLWNFRHRLVRCYWYVFLDRSLRVLDLSLDRGFRVCVCVSPGFLAGSLVVYLKKRYLSKCFNPMLLKEQNDPPSPGVHLTAGQGHSSQTVWCLAVGVGELLLSNEQCSSWGFEPPMTTDKGLSNLIVVYHLGIHCLWGGEVSSPWSIATRRLP